MDRLTDRLKKRSMSGGAEQVMLKNETENRASGRMRADRDDGTSALPTSIINTDRSPSEPLSYPPTPPTLSEEPTARVRERRSPERQMEKEEKPENLDCPRTNTARRADGRRG